MRVGKADDIERELKTFAFFRDFPPEMLKSFAALTQERRIADGELLLEQGKSNHRLFFLRSGKLRIEVDGEPVNELSSPGDVVGEMSVINRTPIAASVRAVGEALAFEVSDEGLSARDSSDRDRLRSLLDRVYSSVLAARLTATNEKAKGFEIANRELMKAQAKLKRINESLEDELARRSREIATKARDLLATRLAPAHVALASWARGDGAAPEPLEIRELADKLAETIDYLKPLSDLADKGRDSGVTRVLFLDASKKQQNIARLALGGTGVDLNVAGTSDEFASALASGEYDAVVCDGAFAAEAKTVISVQPNARLVLMASPDFATYLNLIREFPKGAFFVGRDPEDRALTIKNISSTASKIVNRNVFGLEKHLAWGTRFLERPVRDSRERAGLIDEMAAHFKALGIREALLDRVRAAAEELLMNAIYDAPCDASGKPMYNHLPRTETVTLRSDHEASLRYGTDGAFLGLSVSDPFGALTRGTVARYLEAGLSGVESPHESSVQGEGEHGAKGGAGRGLKMLIDSADLTVFNVATRKKTEVISLFRLEGAAAGDAGPPTFHLFCVD